MAPVQCLSGVLEAVQTLDTPTALQLLFHVTKDPEVSFESC